MLAGTFNSNSGTLTAVLGSTVYTVDKSHQNYQKLLESFKQKDEDSFKKFYSSTLQEVKLQTVLAEVDNTGLVFENDKLYYNGKELHHGYVNRIVEARANGFPVDSMLKFFENLLQNPSSRAVSELPDFMENKNLPLTEDGHFLAYKSVRSDWYSKANGNLTLLSGKADNAGHIYNAVGEVIECVRNEVDDERGNTCSHGLHVGGLQYSGPGGWYNSSSDKVVIVKVNPKDVVSVPQDHNAQKVRVAKYEVIGVYERPLNDNYEGLEPTLEKLEDKPDRVLTLDNVTKLDTVSFLYKGKNDSYHSRRFMIVEEVLEDGFFGVLLPDDPSYEEGNESRKFLKSGIKDLSWFDNEYDYDEEDDEDYYENNDWD